MRIVAFAVLLAVLLAAALAGTASGPAARAADTGLGTLRVHHPWARASIGAAKAGAAYFRVENRGVSADRLIAVETPAARRASLHRNMIEDGVARMRPAGPLEIAPGARLVLEPGGLHVMMMGLSAPLRAGEAFPLTLVFETAGPIEVQVEVVEPQATGPDEGGHAGQMPDG